MFVMRQCLVLIHQMLQNMPTSGPATPLLNWQVRQTGYVAELWKAWGGTFQAHTSLSPTGTWGKEAMVLAIMVAALIPWSC